MRAGQLTETVELWRKVVTTSAYNEQVESYERLQYMRADVVPHQGGMGVGGGIEHSTQPIDFRVRIYNYVKYTDRIKWRGDTYEVVSVVRDRKNSMLIVSAELRDKSYGNN